MATYSPAKNSAATWGSGVKGSDMDQTRKLYRSQTDRKLAGVCGGLANYLKMDAIIIRVGFVVLTVLGGAGIPYLPGDVAARPQASPERRGGTF